MTDDIDTEELIKIVRTKSKEPIEDMPDIKAFILDKGIKSGPMKVMSSEVYNLYKEWASTTNTQVRTRLGFFRIFAQYFSPNKSSPTQRVYYLEQAPFLDKHVIEASNEEKKEGTTS